MTLQAIEFTPFIAVISIAVASAAPNDDSCWSMLNMLADHGRLR